MIACTDQCNYTAGMFDPKILDDIAEKLSAVIPDSVSSFESGAKEKIKTVLTNVFDKLELVTQKEFDVQKEVLNRTRQKVDALEKQLQALEKSLNK